MFIMGKSWHGMTLGDGLSIDNIDFVNWAHQMITLGYQILEVYLEDDFMMTLDMMMPQFHVYDICHSYMAFWYANCTNISDTWDIKVVPCGMTHINTFHMLSSDWMLGMTWHVELSYGNIKSSRGVPHI